MNNSFRSDDAAIHSPVRSNRIQFNYNSLKVERHAAPFLPLNPNVKHNKDEAYISHVIHE